MQIEEVEQVKERWKPVVGFEEFYQVSNAGRIRAIFIGGKNGHLKPLRILSPSRLPAGYLTIVLCPSPGRKRYYRYIHRMVLEAFVGKCPKGKQTRHRDGTKKNNRLTNLCWGTPKQNAKDKDKHGIWGTKLKEKDVIEIRNSTLNTVQLGKIYGVTNTTISHIKRRVTWKHVKSLDLQKSKAML